MEKYHKIFKNGILVNIKCDISGDILMHMWQALCVHKVG